MKFSSETSDGKTRLLLSTAYLPPVSYISACRMTDEILVEACETYTKQTIRNHCRILGPNGCQVLSIPVIKVNGNRTATKDIRIAESEPWQRIHWRSISTAYNNSPFFLYYQDFFSPFFEKRFDFLIDLNHRLMESIFGILKISKPISLTKEFANPGSVTNDYRFYWKKNDRSVSASFPGYTQVFSGRHEFVPDLSILDLIFNLGPEASAYLESLPQP
jgi:hypothetical protein